MHPAFNLPMGADAGSRNLGIIYHMRYGVFIIEPGEDESGEESEGESENEDESDNDGSVPDAAAYQTPEN